jgi:hypothetical protein
MTEVYLNGCSVPVVCDCAAILGIQCGVKKLPKDKFLLIISWHCVSTLYAYFHWGGGGGEKAVWFLDKELDLFSFSKQK